MPASSCTWASAAFSSPITWASKALFLSARLSQRVATPRASLFSSMVWKSVISASSMRLQAPARSAAGGTDYMRNTPKRVGSIGAFNAADSASPSTSRVCAGSITPSSHSRALE